MRRLCYKRNWVRFLSTMSTNLWSWIYRMSICETYCASRNPELGTPISYSCNGPSPLHQHLWWELPIHQLPLCCDMDFILVYFLKGSASIYSTQHMQHMHNGAVRQKEPGSWWLRATMSASGPCLYETEMNTDHKRQLFLVSCISHPPSDPKYKQ